MTGGPPNLPPQPQPIAATAPYRPQFGSLSSYLLFRLIAFAVDGLLLPFLIASALYDKVSGGQPLGISAPALTAHNEGGFVALAGISIGAAIVVTYLAEAIFGTTIGKLVFGLTVRTPKGSWAGFGRALVRNLLRPLDLVLIGPLLALLTPRHQRLGDLVAGTVVARSRLGPFANVIGVVLVAGLAYAQYQFGGGVASATAVAALTASYAPQLFGQARAVEGALFPSGPAPAGLPSASPSPEASPVATPSPAGQESSPAASGAPSPAPTDAASPPAETSAPVEAPTDSPAAAPSDAPTADSSS